ncbi:hypothetical protein EG860_16020, partial [Enterococcus faecalis]
LAKSHWPAAAILGRACKADARGSGREKSHWPQSGPGMQIRGARETPPRAHWPGRAEMAAAGAGHAK